MRVIVMGKKGYIGTAIPRGIQHNTHFKDSLKGGRVDGKVQSVSICALKLANHSKIPPQHEKNGLKTDFLR